MASERTRNIAVGLTMLVALGLLMYGILLLGKGPAFLQGRPYLVTLETPDANGVMPGSKVNLQGVPVGEVKSVALETKPDNTLGAKVILSIDGSVNIPDNASASIGKGYVGSTPVRHHFWWRGRWTPPKDGSGTLHVQPPTAG